MLNFWASSVAFTDIVIGDTGRRDVLYSILTEFGITRKLVGLIKTC
jgi:hypothetical protein